MATAPHSLASESAVAVLREGGNAVEAMIAAAATISVVYPHMNGIGGDAFWLVHEPGKPVTTIDACGPAAMAASRDWYAAQGVSAIPFRGPIAANTVAGTIAGWGLAQQLSAQRFGGRLPLSRLLADAIHYAAHGHAVTHSYTNTTRTKLA
ncbi:MAG: gamma-glutamyltransferase, partial [Pseudomonadota bacterium]